MSRRTVFQQMVYDSSSSSDDDELFFSLAAIAQEEYEQSNAPRHGGSVPGRRIVPRARLSAANRLYRDYFSEDPIYDSTTFRRRFRMSRPLFLRIVNAVVQHDNYFMQRRNCAGVLGLSSLQKITAAFRMLAYGAPADALDEYIQIGESTAIESLKRFVKAVVEVFEDVYLRSPNVSDTARLLAMGEQMGFPGMLGSIDCMHWRWKNCPTAWQGMYTGHVHEPTIILEAVASQDLWIWHAFFGLPGSLNDINVLHRSPLFARLSEGQAPEVNYIINGHNYKMGYYLADGIYPNWATIVKTISSPLGNKRQNFAQRQEAARKAVERAFGVLQARFAIVRGPARLWDQETLAQIMRACIIMHNMIVEDERDQGQSEINYEGMGERVTVSHRPTPELDGFIQTQHDIRNRHTHSQLQDDLVEHLWQFHGGIN